MSTESEQQLIQQQQADQPQQIAQPQVVQPQVVHQQPQMVYQGCCCPFGKTLPTKHQTASIIIGSCILIDGLICLITGIVGFFTTNTYYDYHPQPHHLQKRLSIIYRYNIAVYIGANIWVGIPVSTQLMETIF